MIIRAFLTSAVIAAAGAGFGWNVLAENTHPKTTNVPGPTNVVIFLTDDLGYGDLGCYGNPIIKTPNLDKFATEGALLTDGHAAGVVCSPSRAGLLTGRNPHRSGFYRIAGENTFLADDETTIAEVLKKNGYETCFVGKWHLSTLDKKNHPGPGEQGFDYWMGTNGCGIDGPKNPKGFIRNDVPVRETDGWYCDVITDEATVWLKDKRDSSKPFFLYIATAEPHTPISPPEKYSEIYNTEEVDSLETTISYGGVKRPDRDISDNKNEYYGTVSQIDNAFGNLLEIIEDLGLRDNTLIIFTSDNGPETPFTSDDSEGYSWNDPRTDKCFGSPGHFRGMKRYPYEGGHRVPLIARLPGVIPAGIKSNKLFNGTDFLPTISKLVGAPLPEGINIDGKVNVNAFLNKEIDRNAPEMWFYYHHSATPRWMPQMAMRHGQYTLLGWLPKRKDGLHEWYFNNKPVRVELYDIVNDPGQNNDLAEKKPEVVSDLSPIMEQLFTDMRDEGLKK